MLNTFTVSDTTLSKNSTAMSPVVKNNNCLLQLLATRPAHQHQFLIQTATPRRLHALVQVLFNILLRNTFSSLKKIRENCCHIKILCSKPRRKKISLTKQRSEFFEFLYKTDGGFIQDPFTVFDAIKEETKL